MVKWNWNAIKKDMQKGLSEGFAIVKEGAVVVKKKAGELTEEGKRQYGILEIKAKIQKSMWDLGSRVYDLMRTKAKNPALDPRVKETVEKIKKFEARIVALGKRQPPAAGRKKAVKK